MKAVTLSFEKFGFLRNVTAEEAGEFLLVILDYAMTGKMPELKDKYQKMYYQTYLDVITEQMILLRSVPTIFARQGKSSVC